MTAVPEQQQPAARLPLIAEDEATGRVAELYEQVRTATGLPFVPDVFRLTSTAPDLLAAVVSGYTGIFGDGGALPRATKELIAAWTSKLNRCSYCFGAHTWFLRQFGGSPEMIAAVENATSPAALPVDARTLALLRLAERVTTAAPEITDAEWAAAAEAGWSPAELLEAVFCAALFNFINRLVDAAGI